MRLPSVAFLCLLLASCRGILGPELRGTFEAEVSGAVVVSLEGKASAGYTGGSGTSGYLIDLAVPDGRGVFIQFPSRPTAGTYAIEPYSAGTPTGPRASFLSESNGGAYLGTEGTITIAEGRRSGSFDFTAEDLGRTVQVRGSFSLRRTGVL